MFGVWSFTFSVMGLGALCLSTNLGGFDFFVCFPRK